MVSMGLIEILAANLRTLRDLRGLGQSDVADTVGVSRRTIARLEAGRVGDPGYSQVRAIARALGVSAELLAEERLVSCTVPLPDWVQEQLAGPRSAELLDLLVAEARRMRGSEWHQSSS